MLEIVKHVAQEIRYCELTNLVGKQVLISGIDHIEADIVKVFGEEFQGEISLIPNSRQRIALLKYGILDLDFVTNTNTLDDCEYGFSLLKKLNFLDSKPPQNALEELLPTFPEEFSCFQEMIDDITKTKTYIKFFLRGTAVAKSGIDSKSELPNGFFPHQFDVEDACITNTSLVWLFKHFYL